MTVYNPLDYENLIYSLMNRYYPIKGTWEDNLQDCWEIVIDICKDFNSPKRGITTEIFYRLKKHLTVKSVQKYDKLYRPQFLIEADRVIRKARTKLLNTLKREPTEDELRIESNLNGNQFDLVIKYNSIDFISIEQASPNERGLIESIPDKQIDLEQNINSKVVSKAIDRLNYKNSNKLIKEILDNDLNVNQISKKYNMTYTTTQARIKKGYEILNKEGILS